MTTDHDHDWRVEEYRTLRAEILGNQVCQTNLVIWGGGALVTALGFVFGNQAPKDYRYMLIGFIQVLAMAFWLTWERWALHTERIGAYICLRLERTSALNWELFQRAPLLVREELPNGMSPVRKSLGARLWAVVSAILPFLAKKEDQEGEYAGSAAFQKSFWVHLWSVLGMTLPFVAICFVCSASLVLDLPDGKITWAQPGTRRAFQYLSIVALVVMLGRTLWVAGHSKNTIALLLGVNSGLEQAEAFRSHFHDRTHRGSNSTRWVPRTSKETALCRLR